VSTAARLLRDDLRTFAGYRSARSGAALQGDAWLNANESPSPSTVDAEGRLRRYPDPQPPALREALARLYGVAPAQLLATRGSDEGIDLLLRAFCLPGHGAIVVAPPVFGMYAVCARLHGARVVEVPARDGASGWRSDLDAMADAARREVARLVFVCNPGNPTGEAVDTRDIARLAQQLAGDALVVVDAAYGEFAEADDMVSLLPSHDNLVILRTLSKAHALAGARIGCVIATEEAIAMLARCQAPYPLAQPAVDAALRALAPTALDQTSRATAAVRFEREALRERLGGLRGVRRVYRSQGNFLLARFEDAQAAFDALLACGVVVRDMRETPGLGDALRITIGTPAQNARVFEALALARVAA
jgi:histidinol-phosphate aminotransferase